MAELKTKPSTRSVSAFLASIADESVRRDCRQLARIMGQATHSRPKMWGSSIVGFGKYRYHYESGRSGEWFFTGFAPRKRDLTLYIMSGFDGRRADEEPGKVQDRQGLPVLEAAG